MEKNVRSWSLFALPLIACCVAGFCLNADKDEYKIAIISGKDTLPVTRNSVIPVLGTESFTFQFKMPKAKECEVDIYASEKPDDYRAFMKGTPLDSITPFQTGNAFGVMLNSQGTLGHDLIVSRDGRRPYLYQGTSSMSFHRMKSTHTENIFYYDVNEIYYINYAKKIQRTIAFEQFQVDTLYVIMSFSSKTDHWKQHGTTAFKLAMK